MRRILFVLLFVSSLAAAQQQPIVRVDVSPEEVTVGESIRLRVTVLVPTWFPKPPVFPSFELANVITRLPPDSSNPTSERIDGDTWSGIIRNYQVYPLAAATFRIGDTRMQITYADPGASPIVTEVAVPDIVFRASVPSGAEQLDPYIAGTRLSIARETDGDLDSLKAGDALVVRTVVELEGLPAIFLPPLPELPDAPGVSVYADEPRLEEGGVAKRTESSTLVFDAGGDFVLPAVTLEWWNLAEGRIEETSLPELTVSVSGPPPVVPGGDSEPIDWRWLLVLAGIAAVLILLAAVVVPRARHWQRDRAERYKASEEHAFRMLKDQSGSKDAKAAYAALIQWLEKLEPGMGPRQFADLYGDEDLKIEVDKLVRSAFAGERPGRQTDSLMQALALARDRCIRRRETGAESSLPQLNPGGPVRPSLTVPVD